VFLFFEKSGTSFFISVHTLDAISLRNEILGPVDNFTGMVSNL